MGWAQDYITHRTQLPTPQQIEQRWGGGHWYLSDSHSCACKNSQTMVSNSHHNYIEVNTTFLWSYSNCSGYVAFTNGTLL